MEELPGVLPNDNESILALKHRADKGDTEAAYELGKCYQLGRKGITKDLPLALHYIQLAAASNHPNALMTMGEAYQFGLNFGLKLDFPKAVHLYQSAADLGSADATVLLAVCCKLGTGTPKDSKRGTDLYKKAASLGHPYAKIQLHAESKLGDEEHEQAKRDLKALAEAGDPMAMYRLGMCFENGKSFQMNKTTALEWYVKSANYGNASAQFNSGVFYDNGYGTAKDYTRAIVYYKRAADQGHAKAQNSVGNCYDTGRGVEKDALKAAEWFRKSAEQGHPTGSSNLGLLYYYGRGVAKDLSQAAFWFKRAADGGFARAQYMYGQCLLHGDGVLQDVHEAITWYKKAAEQNRAEALYVLGTCYEKGEGVSKDIDKALEYYEKSSSQTYRYAQEAVTRLKKEIEDKKLSVESDQSTEKSTQSILSSTTKKMTLDEFLRQLDLMKYLPNFQKEEIDYDTLTFLSDDDLSSLGLPLGPRRKIMGHLGTLKPVNLVSNYVSSYTKDKAYSNDILFVYDHDDETICQLKENIKRSLASICFGIRIFDSYLSTSDPKYKITIKNTKNYIVLVSNELYKDVNAVSIIEEATSLEKNLLLITDLIQPSSPFPTKVNDLLTASKINQSQTRPTFSASARHLADALE